jgi:hypothetical protein
MFVLLDPVTSSLDAHTYSNIDEAYEESRLAIQEGHAVLNEIASSDEDSVIMGDETAHKKRGNDDYDSE